MLWYKRLPHRSWMFENLTFWNSCLCSTFVIPSFSSLQRPVPRHISLHSKSFLGQVCHLIVTDWISKRLSLRNLEGRQMQMQDWYFKWLFCQKNFPDAEIFDKKTVLKNYAKFTRKHMCRSFLFMMLGLLASPFIEHF